MAHFAKLDENDTVIEIIVVDNADCLNAEGQECEQTGIAFCQNLLGGNWAQTSYNGNIRFRYAGIGYTFNRTLNAFITPQPYPSWTFDETTTDWTPPVPKPEEGLWVWDEETLTWLEVDAS